MRYDDILTHLGEFGRYQKCLFLAICLLAVPCSWHSLGNTFLSASPEHYCRSYPGQSYEDLSAVKNCTIPYSRNGGGWSKCERYNVSVLSSADADQCSTLDEADDSVAMPTTVACNHGYVYDTTFYRSSAVSQVRS